MIQVYLHHADKVIAMDFSMNVESILLQKTVQKYLREKCPGQVIKNILKSEKGFSEQIWQDMADMGWLGLIHEEIYGGIGCSYLDLVLLFQEIGRARLPSPLYTSAFLSASIISESNDDQAKSTYLPTLINGAKIMTAGLFDKHGLFEQNNEEIKAQQHSDGTYILNGTKILVPYAHIADSLILISDIEGVHPTGPTLFIIDPRQEGLTVYPLETLTGEKACAVKLNHLVASDKQIVGAIGQGAHYIDRVSPKAKIIRCGEMLGGLERVTELTINYVQTRHQFDRPLGSMQIIQHHCVDMYTNVVTAKLITYQAASLLSEGIPCSKEVAMAKAWCNEAYKKATWVAHQIHGAIGFCEEHDLHLYYKHAKTLELEWGDTFHQNRCIAETMGI